MYSTKEQELYNINDDMFIFGNVKYLAPSTFKRYLYKYIEIAKV